MSQKIVELPKFESYGHRASVCECDLVGGDPDCKIKPAYERPYDQLARRFLTLLQSLSDVGIEVVGGKARPVYTREYGLLEAADIVDKLSDCSSCFIAYMIRKASTDPVPPSSTAKEVKI